MGRCQGGFNLRKHGFAFEDAAHVFLDASRIDMVDDREGYDEIRWLTIGWAGSALLIVACTLHGADENVIRIISARKANASERAYYRENEA